MVEIELNLTNINDMFIKKHPRGEKNGNLIWAQKYYFFHLKY